jgi:hypothetical protein
VLLLLLLTVSPIVAIIAPLACLPISPVSKVICRNDRIKLEKTALLAKCPCFGICSAFGKLLSEL